MEAFRRLSQESQAPLHVSESHEPSMAHLVRDCSSRSGESCEYVELETVTISSPNEGGNKERHVGLSGSGQTLNHPSALPKYAASIRRRVDWWSWHSAWRMYFFLLAGIAFAVGHHMYYKSLDGQPATDQAKKLRYGTFMAFLTKACLIWAVTIALRQRIWNTLQSKSLSLQGVDSLFAIADDPMATLDWKTSMNARVVILLASIAWLGPVMVILASQAVSVEPTIDRGGLCPGVTTFNFSLESVEEWRTPTMINGLVASSLSIWNTTAYSIDHSTSLAVQDAQGFDYWTYPTATLTDVANAVATIIKRVLYRPDASQKACGPDWDCRYIVNFTAPGYKCEIASVGTHTESKGLPGMIIPFGSDVLLPKGKNSYYAHAFWGEYSGEQIAPVAPGGIPLDNNGEPLKPPLPKHLGAFRTEPVIWVGYSTMTGSGEAPKNRTEPGWDDYYTPKTFFCEMYETEYLVEFEHSRGIQSVQVKDRKYVAPILNTTFLPEKPSKDGTNDNITAFPESNYVYPNDSSRYRYVAAYHSLGFVFRNIINGTIDANQIHFPSADTRALRSKLFDQRNHFFPVPNLMEAMQGMFEDILLSMFSYPQLLVVAWAANPSLMTGELTGEWYRDETTMYACEKSKPENRFRYHPIELGAVYGISILLAAAAIRIGTISVIQNGGVLKNTRFSSIATLLQHCGYNFEILRLSVPQERSTGNS
ncbi:hypothetical protein PG984_012241 [Apiospora sp. TS-2023a]